MGVETTALSTWSNDSPFHDAQRWHDEIGWWRHAGKTASPLRGPTQRECRPRKSDGAKYANERPTLTCADFDRMATPLGCGASFRLGQSKRADVDYRDVVNILRDGVLLCNDCYAAYVATSPGNVYVGFCETLNGGPLHKAPDPGGLLASLVCGSTAKLHWVKDPPKPRQFRIERLSDRPRGHWAGDEWVSDAA